MAKKVVGGKYYDFGAFRLYSVSTALTANTTVIAGGREGDLVKTSHATGKASLFRLDSGLKVQYLVNA